MATASIIFGETLLSLAHNQKADDHIISAFICIASTVISCIRPLQRRLYIAEPSRDPRRKILHQLGKANLEGGPILLKLTQDDNCGNLPAILNNNKSRIMIVIKINNNS